MNNFFNIKFTAVNYTLTDTDEYVGATASGITITLPAGVKGRWYYIKNQVTGTVTVQGTGTDSIDGSAAKILHTNSGIMLVFDNVRWNIL
jgi:hypothetical protein